MIGGILSGVAGIGNMLGGLIGRKKRQQALNKREDTAVQRRAKDLQAAGLSQTLAAGSAAGSSDVAMQDPGGGDVIADAMQTVEAETAVKKAKADISKTSSEKKLTDLQADRVKLENDQFYKLNWQKEQEAALKRGYDAQKENREAYVHDWNKNRAIKDNSVFGQGKEARLTTAINDIIELVKSTGGGPAIDEAVERAKGIFTPKTPDQMSDAGLGIREFFGNLTPEQAAEKARRAQAEYQKTHNNPFNPR